MLNLSQFYVSPTKNIIYLQKNLSDFLIWVLKFKRFSIFQLIHTAQHCNVKIENHSTINEELKSLNWYLRISAFVVA